MAETIIPRSQHWKPGRKAYWFWSTKEKMALWRYDAKQKVDKERKESGNYFDDQPAAERYGKRLSKASA